MKCAIGLCGHCQFGPAVHLQGRPGVRAIDRRDDVCSRTGRSEHGACNGAQDRAKPKLAVWKFASCDGCQLSLLDCEDETARGRRRGRDRLLPRGDARVRSRARTTSRWSRARSPPPHDAERIRADPPRSRGAWSRSAPAPPPAASRRCATSPTSSEFASVVYAPPEYIDTLATSTPIADHVPVDFELRGCPINKQQLLEVITAFLARPHDPTRRAHSVCVECKLRGNVCVMVAHGTPCLGPVTHAGCGALCPAYDRGCYGCFGPMETPNTAVARGVRRLGASDGQSARCRSVQRRRAGVPPQRRLRAKHRCLTAASATRGEPAGIRRRPNEDPTIKVDYLARVEGEGALHLRIRDGAVEDVGAAHLRAAALLRGLPARPRLHARRPTSPRASAASARSPTR